MFRGAEAAFGAIDPADPTGCTSLGAFFAASERQVPGLDDVAAPETVTVVVTKFNTCTNEELLLGIANPAFLPQGSFRVNDALTSATLVATINVFDWVSNATIPVDVNITWQAKPGGATHSGPYHDVILSPSVKLVLLGDIKTSWIAQATGTVIVGGQNLTPSASTWADLDALMSRTIVVNHERVATPISHVLPPMDRGVGTHGAHPVFT